MLKRRQSHQIHLYLSELFFYEVSYSITYASTVVIIETSEGQLIFESEERLAFKLRAFVLVLDEGFTF